jgi:hypothetical protein
MYNQLQNFYPHDPSISIKRLGRSGPGIGKVSRLLNYVLFYLGSIWHLFMKRPSTVLYYETISSFPAFCYKRFIVPRARIMIHYHEYTSPKEYKQGMWLTKYFHQLEYWLYPRAVWVSHTNQYRMDFFRQDIMPEKILNPEVVPNFPSRHWHKRNTSPPGLPIRFIYVGALAMDTMYAREMAEWILKQEGQATWHIYSFNITAEAKEYLNRLHSPWIELTEGKDYVALPAILCNYHIGVILYKGHIPNYVYNAPNKMFEYLNSGLQVWIPSEMTGAMDYVDGIMVHTIDYNKLQSGAVPDFIIPKYETDRRMFYAEEAFFSFKEVLLKNSKD